MKHLYNFIEALVFALIGVQLMFGPATCYRVLDQIPGLLP